MVKFSKNMREGILNVATQRFSRVVMETKTVAHIKVEEIEGDANVTTYAYTVYSRAREESLKQVTYEASLLQSGMVYVNEIMHRERFASKNWAKELEEIVQEIVENQIRAAGH